MCPRYGKGKWPDDADFIAHAPSDIASLLQALEAAEEFYSRKHAEWVDTATEGWDSARAAEARAEAAEAEVERLQRVVLEFRQKCDPREESVLVSDVEFRIPAAPFYHPYRSIPGDITTQCADCDDQQGHVRQGKEKA